MGADWIAAGESKPSPIGDSDWGKQYERHRCDAAEMATVLDAVEATFDTDFAIVGARQAGCFADPGGFAGSVPGAIAAIAGQKFARVRLRVELWDERPPSHRGWEDADELPFAAVAGRGPLIVHGFELAGAQLDLGRLGSARAQVLASGRQRYGYSSGDRFDLGTLPPEQWRLRIFPDDTGGDALSGEPRRLSGAAPFGPSRASGVAHALAAWDRAGWGWYLRSSVGVEEIRLGISLGEGRYTASEIAAETIRLQGIRGSFDRPAPGTDALDAAVRSSELKIDRVSQLAARPPATTLRELLDACAAIGLLLRCPEQNGDLLLPNPAPRPVWERVQLTEEQLREVRAHIGYGCFERVATDVLNLCRWAAPDGLTLTPRQLALRLAVSPFDVLDAIEHLVTTDRIAADRPVVRSEDVADPVLDERYRLVVLPSPWMH